MNIYLNTFLVICSLFELGSHALSYSIFYLYRVDVKIQGILWLWFFPGVSVSKYIFPGGEFAHLARGTFFGWETDKFFQISSFSEESNRQRFNSRGFMSQAIILSRTYSQVAQWVRTLPKIWFIFISIKYVWPCILFLARKLNQNHKTYRCNLFWI